MVEQNGKEEYVHMIPKNILVAKQNTEAIPFAGIIGGTFIYDVDAASKQELDRVEFQRLLDRTSEFFLGHPYS